MDPITRAAVTNALDVAIARVAQKEISRLSAGLSPDEIAKNISAALRELESLQQGDTPTYGNEWVAVFYLLWYQPAQINLAYTLVQKAAKDNSPLLPRTASLSVLDFGCGSLAMQFGLALAAIDTYQRLGLCPPIILYNYDESEGMKDVGRNTWDGFMAELSRNNAHIVDLLETHLSVNNLDDGNCLHNMDLIDACDVPPRREFRRSNSSVRQEHVRWLTVLHCAYKNNSESIAEILHSCTFYYAPDLVLTTSHPKASGFRFTPKTKYDFYPFYIVEPRPVDEEFGYSRFYNNRNLRPELILKGKLYEISKLRVRLWKAMRGISTGHDDSSIRLLESSVWWRGKASLAADIYAKNAGKRW